RVAITAAIAVALFAVEASAQSPEIPRFEVGGQAGILAVISGDGGIRMTFGPRAAIRVARDLRLEFTGDALVPSDHGLYGLYEILVTATLREGGPARSSLLLPRGTAGLYEISHTGENRSPRRDGSVVVDHAHTSAEVSRPLGAVIGVGFHQPLGPRMAIRSDVKVLVVPSDALVPRATVGASIPIGAKYATRQ